MTPTETERLTRVEEKVDGIREDIADIKDAIKNMDNKFASKLTEIIVYGLCGLILIAVVVALIALVVTRGE